MPFKGESIEFMDPVSDKFKDLQALFANRLVKLYLITHDIFESPEYDSFLYLNQLYYHGTSHCGCLAQQAISASKNSIKASEWCKNQGCATRGILNNGHLLTRSGRGHFFTPQTTIAQEYAVSRSQLHNHLHLSFLSVFIVKAQNIIKHPTPDYFYVSSDTDILPCFLAIVRRQ
ncbi:hypothetical protein BGZ95_010017 [Linnemannia exigua]|uniref:Uncharacterized protein n=1 Tax=Linnemannia exigua TaxID=604196 RepID=A0AAD4DCA2_9FUNG|nr:hypothetical protein BGZ95_010017 [Linnemannia exigua]